MSDNPTKVVGLQSETPSRPPTTTVSREIMGTVYKMVATAETGLPKHQIPPPPTPSNAPPVPTMSLPIDSQTPPKTTATGAAVKLTFRQIQMQPPPATFGALPAPTASPPTGRPSPQAMGAPGKGTSADAAIKLAPPPTQMAPPTATPSPSAGLPIDRPIDPAIDPTTARSLAIRKSLLEMLTLVDITPATSTDPTTTGTMQFKSAPQAPMAATALTGAERLANDPNGKNPNGPPEMKAPPVPQWLENELRKLRETHQREKIEGVMRLYAFDKVTGKRLSDEEYAQQDMKRRRIHHSWTARIICHDCPEKIFATGTKDNQFENSVTGFKAHLKDKQHVERVVARIGMERLDAVANLRRRRG